MKSTKNLDDFEKELFVDGVKVLARTHATWFKPQNIVYPWERDGKHYKGTSASGMAADFFTEEIEKGGHYDKIRESQRRKKTGDS